MLRTSLTPDQLRTKYYELARQYAQFRMIAYIVLSSRETDPVKNAKWLALLDEAIEELDILNGVLKLGKNSTPA